MTTDNPLLARFVPQRPALLAPGNEDWFKMCTRQAAAVPRLGDLLAEAQTHQGLVIAASEDDGFWYARDDWRAAFRPYVVRDGVLHIPVKGALLHDFPFALGSWATGYVYIWRAFQRGMNDSAVRGIALVCDSPGGMVAGCFELVDRMSKLMASTKPTKPVRAFAHEAAYSAAYAVASVADLIVVSRTGGVGSIGVVTYHVDYSKMLEQEGIKVTFIFAGKHKVNGNAFEPLGEDAKKRIQAHIDEIYRIFVATVAKNRDLTEREVRGTEAGCFSATEAVENGLADSIGAFDDAVAAFVADLSSPETGDIEMTVNTNTHTQADVDRAREEGRTEGDRAGREAAARENQAAVTDAVKAERIRTQGILGSDEAKGREKLARHLAFATDMTVEAAVAMLKEAPQADAGKPPNRLDAALRGNNPDVKADTQEAGDGGGASKDYEEGANLYKLYGRGQSVAGKRS